MYKPGSYPMHISVSACTNLNCSTTGKSWKNWHPDQDPRGTSALIMVRAALVPNVLMRCSSLKNTSDSLFPLGSLLQMFPLCSSRHHGLTQGMPGWHFIPEEESFIRNFRFPAGEPVLTPLHVAQDKRICHCKIKNCFFLSVPFLSTQKTMGKYSPLTNTLFKEVTEYARFTEASLLRHKSFKKNVHHSPHEGNNGVTWYHNSREEKLELHFCSQDTVLPIQGIPHKK